MIHKTTPYITATLSAMLSAGCSLIALPLTSYALNIDHNELELIFGEPVTTIATGKPQRESEAPLTIEIIGHDEIKQSGAMDVPQLLQKVAGVDISRNFKGQADVNIRGYNQPLANRLLVLIDGRQVYLDNIGFTLWSAFPIQLNEIKQIEIIRGPNSSLLGYNAASGVVNIITLDPLSKPQSEDIVEARAGTQNHKEASLIHYINLSDQAAVRFSAGRLQSDDFSRDNYPVDTTEEDMLDKTSANIDMRVKVSDDTVVKFEAGYTDLLTDMMFASQGNGTMDIELQHFMLSGTHDSDTFGFLSANLYRNESQFNIAFSKFNSPLPDTAPIDNVLNVFQLSSLKLLDEHHSVRLSTEFRNNSLQGAAIGTGEGKFEISTVGLAAMWEWQIKEGFTFTHSSRIDQWQTERHGGIGITDTHLGLTLEDYDREETDNSYNSSLVYHWNPRLATRISLGKGLHIPSLAELSRAISPNNRIENYGNPRLETEENRTIELGINYRTPNDKLDVEINLFHQDIKNIIGQIVLPPHANNAKADITFENLGKSCANGVEISFKGKLFDQQNQTLSWGANYSYMNLDDETRDDANGNILFETNEPKHKINLSLSYQKDRWSFVNDLHYVDAILYRSSVINFANPLIEEPVDDYITFNSNILYQFTQEASIGLHLYNLLDEHQERPDLGMT